jgi:hypothetical protein
MNRILLFLMLACGFRVAWAGDVAIASLDLSEFGHRLGSFPLVDYTDLTFLSEDLLLISINQRIFGHIEPTFADTPDSTMIVFDLNSRRVVTTGKMAVEKMTDSVQAVVGKRFAVLNEKGLRFCNAALECGQPIETKGPMLVSPQGKRVAVGGNGIGAQKIIDTESLKGCRFRDPLAWTYLSTGGSWRRCHASRERSKGHHSTTRAERSSDSHRLDGEFSRVSLSEF